MKFKADQKGALRFFFAKKGWGEHYNPRELEMLSNGIVPMLIPPSAVSGRKNNVIQFNISDYTTMEFYITCILSREQFAELLLRCIDVLRKMQAVYLSYKNLVVELDKVYISISDRTVHFVYIPTMNNWHEVSLPDFFKTILRTSGQSTYEQVQFINACIEWLNRPSPFLLEEFDAFIRNHVDMSVQDGAVQDPPMPTPPPPITPSPPVTPPWVVNPAKDPNAPTSGLEGPAEPGKQTPPIFPPLPLSGTSYYLLRDSTNETVEITEFPFLIGKEFGVVSYCITGNPAVSRRHAILEFVDGHCVIIDQNSTNKTYVNNYALEPHTAHQLQDGDQIRLGNECFTFIAEAEQSASLTDATVVL